MLQSRAEALNTELKHSIKGSSLGLEYIATCSQPHKHTQATAYLHSLVKEPTAYHTSLKAEYEHAQWFMDDSLIMDLELVINKYVYAIFACHCSETRSLLHDLLNFNALKYRLDTI